MRVNLAVLILTAFAVWTQTIAVASNGGSRFTIDQTAKAFKLNGHPFLYVSASIHYFRCHPGYWDDRLRKIRAGGFNTIQMYVEWSFHEPTPGKYAFSGGRDVETFIKLAQKNDLFVILRPGPYIDAERDMGGLPFWLLQLNPDVRLRTSDPKFMQYVERWFKVLYTKLAKYTIGKGGPIIMIQIENEYGAYAVQTSSTDTAYMTQLRDLVEQYFDNSVLLFTTDGMRKEEILQSRIPRVYSTVDFGPHDNFTEAFYNQRLFEPDGPMVNSEFYVGWLDYWAYPHSFIDSTAVVTVLDKMLSLGANVNLYMVHGGTSFGFGSGTDLNLTSFQPCTTSYDYDAPISEAGDLTQKFYDIQNVVKKYLPLPDIPVNKSAQKGSFGNVTLSASYSLLYDGHNILKTVEANTPYPKTFEALGQSSGIVLYETTIMQLFKDPAKLSVKGIKDRGYVFVDGVGPIGILDRISDVTTLPIFIKPGQKLQIFAESLGRVAYGPGLNDFKGIISNVTLNQVILKNWSIKVTPLQQPTDLATSLIQVQNSVTYDDTKFMSALGKSGGSMSFWQGQFNGCVNGTARDTFLDMSGWRKGLAYINGFNLGRYWSAVGPQVTLYVPAPILHQNCSMANSITIFEQERSPCIEDEQVVGDNTKCAVQFVNKPQLNGPVPVA